MRTSGGCFSHLVIDLTAKLSYTTCDAVAQPGRHTGKGIIADVLIDKDKPRIFKRPDSSSSQDVRTAIITPHSHSVDVRT